MHKNNTKFDVIVMYSGLIAKSAGDQHYKGDSPFSARSRHNDCNDSYQYFLESCRKIGLKVAFSTSNDIIDSGKCQSYWTYDKKWIRNLGSVSSMLIYDKFTPKSRAQILQLKLLTSSNSVTTFTNRKLSYIFKNKLRTYQQFKEIAIPTVAVNGPTRQKLLQAKSKLDVLVQKNNIQNYSRDGYLIKDNRGAGGFKIYRLDFDDQGIASIIKQYKSDRRNEQNLSYVLQPFIDCRNSSVIHNHTGLIDLRVILMHDKIIQAYIRIASPSNYKCNEHQGGDLVYIPLNTIPDDVRVMASNIAKTLSSKCDIQQSLYALDFMRDRRKGQLYFIEGNNNPGLDWNHLKKDNARKSKDLINIITKKLKEVSV